MTTPAEVAEAELDARIADLERSNAGAPPVKRESWRKRTATGAILTGLAMGFQEALEPRREEPSIMMEASGTPPTDLPVDAEVGQIRPADNVVTIRPWLLRPVEGAPDSDQDAKDSDQDAKDSDQDAKDSDQDAKDSDRDAKGDGHEEPRRP